MWCDDIQGIYYYFYQLLKNKAESIAAARKKKGLGDGTVGMFSWLVVAAIAGWVLFMSQLGHNFYLCEDIFHLQLLR